MSSTSLFSQTLTCRDFKNGTFKLLDPKYGNSIIERKGSKQIEYSEKLKLKVRFKVKWISDCTYTLKLKKIIENPNNIDFPENLILTVKIIETKENSYTQRTSSNLYETVLENKLTRIE